MQKKIRPNQAISMIQTLLLYILLSPFSAISIAADAPSETVKTFYQLIAKQQCEAAIKLRPDYSLQRCKKITKTHIHKVTTELSDNKNAVLLLELDSFYNKKKSYFFGYVRLAKKNNQWLIIGPFKSREDYWLDEYVKTYIPGEFQGLSEAERKKKFTPPPPPNISSQSTSKKERIENENIIPPGDSIDADEFIPQSENKTDIKQKQSNINQKTVITKKEKNPITPDAQKLISGTDAIAGNYTALLIKIRKNFPTNKMDNILLIDKSRRTIYTYNNKNLLLAFFPILSSDNSHFPSGMYRINSNNPRQSIKSVIPETNQPIMLEKLPKIDSKNHPSIAKKQHYYIRDLFDADKTNSLQLSPIDLNKLHSFVSFSTMAYSGQ